MAGPPRTRPTLGTGPRNTRQNVKHCQPWPTLPRGEHCLAAAGWQAALLSRLQWQPVGSSATRRVQSPPALIARSLAACEPANICKESVLGGRQRLADRVVSEEVPPQLPGDNARTLIRGLGCGRKLCPSIHPSGITKLRSVGTMHP